jgi:osmotically-inducible protein OsmY
MKADRKLQEDVLAELAWDPSIEASRIGVEVEDGIVTLSGHVPSFAEKEAARRAAQRVSGVKGVAVDVHVVLPGQSIRTDADIAKSASSMLSWSTSVPYEVVKVSVEDGWVSLTGTVDWAYQRDAAVDCVRSLIGVKGVVNRIEVAPKTTSGDVKTKIEAALQRRAHLDTKAVNVDVSDGTVTLSGHVDSFSERSTMEKAAWAAPGVRHVVDNLTIK